MNNLTNTERGVLIDFTTDWGDLDEDIQRQVEAFIDGNREDVEVEGIRVAVTHLRYYPSFIAPMVEWLKAQEVEVEVGK